MADFKAVTIHEEGGRPAAAVHAIPDWDGFEKLLRFVQKHYGATVVEQVDGPDARKAVVEVEGHRIEVLHEDDVGNTLVSAEAGADETLRTLAADLGKRLAGLAPS
ncbi:MAG: hypothetical protein R3F65_31695 [bacterium]